MLSVLSRHVHGRVIAFTCFLVSCFLALCTIAMCPETAIMLAGAKRITSLRLSAVPLPAITVFEQSTCMLCELCW